MSEKQSKQFLFKILQHEQQSLHLEELNIGINFRIMYEIHHPFPYKVGYTIPVISKQVLKEMKSKEESALNNNNFIHQCKNRNRWLK